MPIKTMPTKTGQTETKKLQYGTTTIHYSLERKPRRSLGIEVQINGQVRVIAPPQTPDNLVQTKVLKRAPWILRQQHELATYPPAQTTRQYTSGETHRYLGRQHRLHFVVGSQEQVKLSRGQIEVTSPNPARVKSLLQAWFRLRAEQVLKERMVVCLERVAVFHIRHSGEFKLRAMHKRWGSCTTNGIIYLNPILIAAPKECIDYVIVHELVHTVHLHHGPEFYALLGKCLKNWQELRKKLNTLVEVPIVANNKTPAILKA